MPILTDLNDYKTVASAPPMSDNIALRTIVWMLNQSSVAAGVVTANQGENNSNDKAWPVKLIDALNNVLAIPGNPAHVTDVALQAALTTVFGSTTDLPANAPTNATPETVIALLKAILDKDLAISLTADQIFLSVDDVEEYIGPTNDPVAPSDTATASLNAFLKRIAAHLTEMISNVGDVSDAPDAPTLIGQSKEQTDRLQDIDTTTGTTADAPAVIPATVAPETLVSIHKAAANLLNDILTSLEALDRNAGVVTAETLRVVVEDQMRNVTGAVADAPDALTLFGQSREQTDRVQEIASEIGQPTDLPTTLPATATATTIFALLKASANITREIELTLEELDRGAGLVTLETLRTVLESQSRDALGSTIDAPATVPTSIAPETMIALLKAAVNLLDLSKDVGASDSKTLRVVLENQSRNVLGTTADLTDALTIFGQLLEIKNTQVDKTQFARITDGTDDADVNMTNGSTGAGLATRQLADYNAGASGADTQRVVLEAQSRDAIGVSADAANAATLVGQSKQQTLEQTELNSNVGDVANTPAAVPLTAAPETLISIQKAAANLINQLLTSVEAFDRNVGISTPETLRVVVEDQMRNVLGATSDLADALTSYGQLLEQTDRLQELASEVGAPTDLPTTLPADATETTVFALLKATANITREVELTLEELDRNAGAVTAETLRTVLEDQTRNAVGASADAADAASLVGQSKEQTDRLQELATDNGDATDLPTTLPADATPTTIFALLKAQANELQTIANSLGNLDKNVGAAGVETLRTVLENQTRDAIGAQADASATTDTGTFSLLAFFKRHLEKFTNFLVRFPVSLGQKTMAGSLPITLASDQPPIKIERDAFDLPWTNITAINQTPAGASFDVSSYAYLYFQLAGTWVGTVIVEGSNDNTNWQPIQGTSPTFFNTNPSQTQTANGVYKYPCATKFMRIRSSAWTSGTATGAAFISSLDNDDRNVKGAAIVGTVTVDTELPAAATTNDSISNGSQTSIKTFGHGWNGTSWDRNRSGQITPTTAPFGWENSLPFTRFDSAPIARTTGQFAPNQQTSRGAQHVNTRSSDNFVVTQANVTTTAASLSAVNAGLRSSINILPVDGDIAVGSTAGVTFATGRIIRAGDSLTLQTMNQIFAISASGTVDVRLTED